MYVLNNTSAITSAARNTFSAFPWRILFSLWAFFPLPSSFSDNLVHVVKRRWKKVPSDLRPSFCQLIVMDKRRLFDNRRATRSCGEFENLNRANETLRRHYADYCIRAHIQIRDTQVEAP